MHTVLQNGMACRVPSPRPQIRLERENALTWIAWRDDVPGECELVSAEGCTCYRFRFWRRCEHHALLLDRLGHQ